MTKPIKAATKRPSATAEACFAHAIHGDDHMAHVLLHRIQRRRTAAAHRESKALGKMLHYDSVRSDVWDIAWELGSATAVATTEARAAAWKKRAKGAVAELEALEKRAIAAGVQAEKAKKELEYLYGYMRDLEKEMEGWKKRAEIAEAATAQGSRLSRIRLVDRPKSASRIRLVDRPKSADNKDPVAAPTATGPKQNEHTAEKRHSDQASIPSLVIL